MPSNGDSQDEYTTLLQKYLDLEKEDVTLDKKYNELLRVHLALSEENLALGKKHTALLQMYLDLMEKYTELLAGTPKTAG